jgi:hypothetical protein
VDRRGPKAICDRSGFEYPLADLVREWDGLLVHPRFADKRNPQDFIRARPEHQPRETRPEAPDTFLAVNEVTPGSL